MTKYSLPYPLPLKNPHSPFRNFNYIRPIRIVGTNEDLRNYQVKIVLTKYNFPLEKCKNDGSDIRFRDETGEILPYWIQSWNSNEAVVWCKIPFISAHEAKNIWIIYGNPAASSASDGSATFDFYDDFTFPFIREWTPYSGNPVLSPEGDEGLTSWGSVWKDGDTYHMFYSYSDSGNGRKIGHATSSDGKNWTKDTDHNPILTPSGSGWDDGKVWDPAVWKEGSTWYMLYTGRDSAETADAIGLATASDPSGPWTKDSSNPVLEGTSGEWDANTVENMNLMKIGSTYYLWYNTLLGVGSDRKTGLATSTDLINWTKDSNNPIFGESGGYFQPCPFKYGSYYYLLIMHYTSGSDYAEIQLYRDTNPTFYAGEREFIKVVKSCSTSGWDSHDQDTPCVLTDDIYRNSFPNDELWTYYAGESGGTWRTGLLIETDIDLALEKYSGKWIVREGDIPVSDGLLHLQGTTGTRGRIEGKTEVPIGAAIHVRAKYLQLNARTTHFCSFGKPNDENYVITIYDRYSTGRPTSVTINAGVFSQTDWDTIDSPTDWHEYKITWRSSEVKYYQEDTLKATHTNNIPTDNLVARFREGTVSGGDIDIDWVFIRKYTDPEPIVIV